MFDLSIPHIWISLPGHHHNGFGIQFYHPTSEEMLKEFQHQMWRFSDSHQSFGFFHQGNSREWQYFEALGNCDQELLFQLAMNLSDYFNIELEIR